MIDDAEAASFAAARAELEAAVDRVAAPLAPIFATVRALTAQYPALFRRSDNRAERP
jgi:hypothetical protein